MMIMVLLIPLTMIIFGKIFINKPPKKINYIYGYRTTMSMKNKETWEFAHHYIGKIWWTFGRILLIVSILALVYVFNRDADTIGILGGIVVGVQLLFLCLSFVPVEKALKKNFDIDGIRR